LYNSIFNLTLVHLQKQRDFKPLGIITCERNSTDQTIQHACLHRANTSIPFQKQDSCIPYVVQKEFSDQKLTQHILTL